MMIIITNFIRKYFRDSLYFKLYSTITFSPISRLKKCSKNDFSILLHVRFIFMSYLFFCASLRQWVPQIKIIYSNVCRMVCLFAYHIPAIFHKFYETLQLKMTSLSYSVLWFCKGSSLFVGEMTFELHPCYRVPFF